MAGTNGKAREFARRNLLEQRVAIILRGLGSKRSKTSLTLFLLKFTVGFLLLCLIVDEAHFYKKI